MEPFIWQKFISRGIGVFYGLLSIPFGIGLFGALSASFRGAIEPSLMTLLLFSFICGILVVCLGLAVGFWRQNPKTYNIALLIHGLALFGELGRWLGVLLGQDIIGPPNSPLYLLLHGFIVGFILLPRIQGWWQRSREMQYWQEPK